VDDYFGRVMREESPGQYRLTGDMAFAQPYWRFIDYEGGVSGQWKRPKRVPGDDRL
jgi:hypothetical protein